MIRPLPPALILAAALGLPAAPAAGWDWAPPAGEAVVDLGVIDRLSPRWGLILLAGLRRVVREAPPELGLAALHYGVTLQDYRLFDTNRDRLMAVLRALAVDLARHRFGEISPEHAEALMDLAGPYGFGPLDFAAAEAPMRAGTAIVRQLPDQFDDHSFARHLLRLAGTLSALGQHESAVELRRQVLALAQAQPDPQPGSQWRAIWGLAEELNAAGAVDESAALFLEGVALLRAESGRHPTALIGALGQAAGVVEHVDPDQAQRLRAEARQRLAAQLRAGLEIPYTEPRWLIELADLLAGTGEVERASRLHLQALQFSRAMLGADHHQTRELLGRVLSHLQRSDPDNPALAELEAMAARLPEPERR